MTPLLEAVRELPTWQTLIITSLLAQVALFVLRLVCKIIVAVGSK
jgi:hypothetical protein